MSLNNSDDMQTGRANNAIPIASWLFNRFGRPFLNKLTGKPFRINSRSREFMSAAKPSYKQYVVERDGAVITLSGDFQMREAFKQAVFRRGGSRKWSLKVEIKPVFTTVYPDFENNEPVFTISVRASGAATYLVGESLSKQGIKTIIEDWNAGKIKPEDLYSLVEEAQKFERLTSDRSKASRVIGVSGPMIDAGDRIARYDEDKLAEVYSETLEKMQKRANVYQQLVKFTESNDSEIVPIGSGGKREKGLFAKIDIPAGTWLGEYLGPQYNSNEHDEVTYVFAPAKEGDDLGMMERFDLYGRVGKTSLKWANDAPDEDITDWKGRAVKAANMTVDGYDFYAKEDIPAGTELTWNYQGKKWRAYDDPERTSLNLRGGGFIKGLDVQP